MLLAYDIADELQVPNESISIDRVAGKYVWFSTQGLSYTCKLKGRVHERLVKNSIRRDFA
jgi:hypothetical protein